jgi:hypothetical protein
MAYFTIPNISLKNQQIELNSDQSVHLRNLDAHMGMCTLRNQEKGESYLH